MTRSERRVFWVSHFETWQSGEESQAACCRRHELAAMSFSQLKRRFEREQLDATVSQGTGNGAGRHARGPAR